MIMKFNFASASASNDPLLWFKYHALDDHGTLFICCSWFLWKARNGEVFNDTEWGT